MRFAYVVDGKVISVFDVSDEAAIGELYHPDYVSKCIPCAPDVRAGWTYDGDIFLPPSESAPTPDDLKTLAANMRWRRETRGITVNGALVATDDRSQRLILGLRVKADANPDFSTRFKGEDGQWFDVNAASIISISDAVFAHVNDAFSLENSVVDQIDAGAISDEAAVEAAFA